MDREATVGVSEVLAESWRHVSPYRTPGRELEPEELRCRQCGGPRDYALKSEVQARCYKCSHPYVRGEAHQTLTRDELAALLDTKIAAAREFARKVRSGPLMVRVRAEDVACLHDVICELAEMLKEQVGVTRQDTRPDPPPVPMPGPGRSRIG